jgi:diguanylate cyclase (GGDEF)-like protein
MVWTVAAAGLIPLAVLTVFSLRNAEQLLAGQARQQLGLLTHAHAGAIHTRLLAADRVLREVAASLEWGGMPSGALRERVEEEFAFLGIMQREGALRALTGEWRGLFEVSAQLRARLGAGSSALVTQPQGPRARLFLVRAIGGRSPSDAVVVAELSEEYLFPATAAELATAQLCILGAGGERIRCPAGPDEAQARALHAQRHESSSGNFEWTHDGERQLGSYRAMALNGPFVGGDWVLLASQGETQALAPGAAFARTLTVALALCVLGLLGVAIAQSRRANAALDRLTHGARRLADRDLLAQSDLAREAEFSELAQSLTGIAGQFQRDLEVHQALADLDRVMLEGPQIERVAASVAAALQRLLSAQAVGLALRTRGTPGRGTLYLTGSHGGEDVSATPIDFAPLFGEQRLVASPAMWLPAPIPADPVLARVGERGAKHLFVAPVVCNRELAGMLALGFAQRGALSAVEEGCVRQFVDRLAMAYAAATREAQLYYRSRFDTLTGLPNRESFMERVGDRIERARRDGSTVALMLVDLDRFKQINDALGHAAGDDVIRQAAQRLQECARDSDLLSRFGADEFALLLTGLPAPAEAARVAARVARALGAPFLSGERERVLSASVGVAFFPAHADGAETLLRNADTAMYRAKEAGRGKVVLFEERMNEELRRRMAIERELRLAIERDEFVLYYQPQMDVRSGELSGAEVLIRWQHPEQGLLSPAAFIGIAEQTGLIEPIGELVLRKACSQLQHWREQGVAPPRLSVNVSGRQFKRRDFAALVASIVRDSGCEPRFLELEITETLLMEDADASGVVLAQLASQGVRLAIDDFGTGYSSLAYLKRLRFDALKIDRSFVKDVTTDEDSRAIASAIIALARTLRKETVAEGVETREQLDFLRAERCDMIQGYLISKPVPAEDFLAALRASLSKTRTVLRLAARGA